MSEFLGFSFGSNNIKMELFNGDNTLGILVSPLGFASVTIQYLGFTISWLTASHGILISITYYK